MSGRLGGGGRKPMNVISRVSKLHLHVLPDMMTALKQSRRQFVAGVTKKDQARKAAIGDRPITGDADRIKAAMHTSDRLVEDAIAYDPRLARKAEWRRREEGEHVCAALLAEGDDQPFYKRTRNVVNDATQAGQPLKVVISTDDSCVAPDTAAAFIATVRLVQQFIPLEIWWQGAWLNAPEPYSKGFVCQVPLVKGDMDFSRLEFCIADARRDTFSYLLMCAHGVLDLKEGNAGCGGRASYAYKPGNNATAVCDGDSTTKFVTHQGISPTADSISSTAADWLGWDSVWGVKYLDLQAASAAGQSIPEPVTTYPQRSAKETAAEDARWEQRQRESKTQDLKAANSRMVNV